MEIKDKLLNYFGVKSHKELTDYIKNNPNDQKVLMLKEFLKEWGVNLDEENYK